MIKLIEYSAEYCLVFDERCPCAWQGPSLAQERWRSNGRPPITIMGRTCNSPTLRLSREAADTDEGGSQHLFASRWHKQLTLGSTAALCRSSLSHRYFCTTLSFKN